jgi:hypothetical protein
MRLRFQRIIFSSPIGDVQRAVFCFALSSGALSAAAFTPADADTLFEAHPKAFDEEKDGHAWFKESTEGGKISYWMPANASKTRSRGGFHRTSDNLTWPQPTPEGVRYSWSSLSAVVLLQITPPQDPAKPENPP